MRQIMVSLIIGAAAAAIDVMPMILRKLDRGFILSAALFWLVSGIMIPRTGFVQSDWLNGMITSIIIFLPVSILIAKLDRQALPVIIVTTIILGAAIGYVSGKIIGVSIK